jgi:hypothetical protein
VTPPSFEAIDQATEQTRPSIEYIADQLWHLAELSLLEVKKETAEWFYRPLSNLLRAG